jgi:sugar phosphate isomerase/epimerase
MKIGAMTTCFRKPFRESLEICSQLGVDGVQIWATNLTYYFPDHPVGELDPDTLTETGRQDLLATLKRLGLEISALCGDLGRGFTKPDHLEEDIAKIKRMMDMARSLGVTVLTTHIGVVPEDPNAPEYKRLQQVLGEIGAYGDQVGVTFANETGPESGATLAGLLRTLKAQSLKANYDPANLIMSGFDPMQGVYDLRDYIVHTHAKDATGKARGANEVPLGAGEVPWPQYLQALHEIGYRGYLTIEREVGENPSQDIITAAQFLREQLRALGIAK